MSDAELLIVEWVRAVRAELKARVKYDRVALSEVLEEKSAAIAGLHSTALDTARAEAKVMALAATLELGGNP